MNKIAAVKIGRLPPLVGIRTFSVSNATYEKYKCKALIIGGGTGGCSIGAKLASDFKQNECIILEPASQHYYQPMFTLIGGGIKTLSASRRSMESVLPHKAKWIKDAAAKFNPNSNEVITTSDSRFGRSAINSEWERYFNSPKYVDRHLSALKRFQGGNIIFTYPASPVKCPGAPQKICYITEHFLRKNNKRKQAQLHYNSALPVIFGCKYFADSLWKVVDERAVNVNLKTNLVEVQSDKNVAIFTNVENPNERKSFEYSILHAVPPQSVPSVLLDPSNGLSNAAGFVDVNQSTLQHVKYPNVFAIGDCSSTPNSKTMAAIAGQVGVLHKNIKKFLSGQSLGDNYDGYASCPLVTGYDSCIMAEFDYSLQPKETFPFRQDCERYSMYLLKRDFMPFLYWNLMLNGHWNGPAPMRKLFSPFKRS